MITGKWYPAGIRPPEADAVWREAFGETNQPDRAIDALSRVALLWDDNAQAAAAGRLYYMDGAYWLDSVAVIPLRRGMGYGDLLVRMMLDMALIHGGQVVRADVPRGCVKFFERYGFLATDEAGGVSRMEVRARDVRLTCAGSANEAQ